jgi:guanosine-3',5'-bis(diphosphate) 3'-pyrophosphohydrolase
VESLVTTGRKRRRPTGTSKSYGVMVDGVDDVQLRMAKCCRPVPGDPIVGYVSLGRGHHDPSRRLPERRRPAQGSDRFVRVHWEGEHETAFKVELQIDACDRTRLLEELSRTFAEAGINIVEARCVVSSPMVKNTFVVEVGDTRVKSTA